MNPDVTGLGTVAASLSLVALALGLAAWLRMGVGKEITIAIVRAAAQLLAVGALFTAIFATSRPLAWAWLWVAVMVGVATRVVRRRAGRPIPGLVPAAAMAVAMSAGISIAVIFGFDVFEFSAVNLVVVAGITIGNAVPSAALAVDQSVKTCTTGVGEIEALLSLGADGRLTTRFLAPRAARSALLPQIERTKVVGLIALPGAMTGLLLAGVDPVDAVIIQLLVMYLVLGTAAVCVVTVVAAIVRRAVTPDLTVASWARPGTHLAE